MRQPEGQSKSVSVALVGSGGAGVMTAGAMLLDLAAAAGLYGLMTRSLGPQIRGGEAAALLRFSTTPVESHDDCFDVLFAIDWLNFDRFAREVPLGPHTIVISDADIPVLPNAVIDAKAKVHTLPMAQMLKKIKGGRLNMMSLGVVASVLGLPSDLVIRNISRKLAKKGEKAVASGKETFLAGFEAGKTLDMDFSLPLPAEISGERWKISGNQAVALGALRGGVRFVAGYPITPATDILEWMAPRLPKLGGALVQAEDELASINMIIGSSFGGVPSLTATSGPGLALMTESIGLAVAAEVPIVVVNVMRGGPSTGIATKSEQSDLNIAVHGLHGDAPHIVVAPNSVADCALTGQWATYLAEKLQTAAIVLSDQALGQSRAVVAAAADSGLKPSRLIDNKNNGKAERYAITESGVSPMTIPGMAGGQYISEGLTHNKYGSPSTRAEDHTGQIAKRHDKLANFDFGSYWADIEGDGELAIISWGSVCMPIREAISRLNGRAADVRLIALRLISPAQPQHMAAALSGVKRVLVVEQTHSGQLLRLLRADYDLPKDVISFRRAGPLAFSPGELRDEIARLL